MADPKIKYDIEAIVSGSADVLALANNIEKLSSGFDGEIKEKALSTAASLRELARQDALLQSFGELRNSLIATSQKLAEAKQNIKDLDGVMSLAGKSTREQEGAMQKLKDTAKSLENEFGTQSVAVDKYAKELALAGIKADDFVNAQVRVKNSLSSIKSEAATMASVLSGVGDGAVKSGQKLQEAFGILGLRSAEQLEVEIAKVRGAMETVSNASAKTGTSLSGAFSAGNAKIKELEREMRQLNGTMTFGDRAASLFSQSVRHIAAGNVIADGVGYLAGKVKQLGAEFFGTITEAEQFRKGLNAVYKDSTLAGQQFDFMKKQANAVGVAIGDIAQDFLKYSAANKSANIPLEQTNALFTQVIRAGSALGLSNQEVSGTLNALGQMASKGIVTMEELRQQLGDRLPGALSLAAKGMGITESELVKLVSSGDLAYRDFIVPFTNGLKELAGETEGIIPSWSRFKNALTEAAQAAGDSGWTQLLTLSVKGLSVALGAVVIPLHALSEGLMFVGKAALAMYGALRGDSGGFKFLSEEAEKATARMLKVRDAFAAAAGGASANEDANKKLADQYKNVSTTILKTGESIDGLSNSQKALKLVQDIANDSALAQGASIVKLSLALGKLLESQQAQTEASKKSVAAAKDEGAAIVKLAEAIGNQEGILKAKAQASKLVADADAALLKSQQEELVILNAKKQALLDDAAARKLSSDAIKAQVEAVDKSIAQTESVIAASKQSVAQSDSAALSAKTLSEAYKDNSKSVDDYRKQLEAASATVKSYEQLQAQGKKTQDDVNRAKGEVVRLQALINDGIKDQVVAEEALAIKKVSEKNVLVSELELKKSLNSQAYELAKLMGDEQGMRAAKIEQVKIEIQLTKAKADVAKAEAEGSIAVAQAKLAELKASGQLTPVKEAEINASIKLANAKIAEAKAVGGSTALLEKQLELLQNGTTQMEGFGRASNNASGGQDKLASSTDKATSALEKQNAATQKANEIREKSDELERKRIGVDKDGFSANKDGQRIVQGNDLGTRLGILNFLKSAGVDDEAAAQSIANEFADSNGNITQINNPGQLKYNRRDPFGTLSQAVLRAAEDYRFKKKTQNQDQSAGTQAATSANTANPAAPPSAAGGRVVNINIGGNRFPVNTDAQGAENLVAALRVGARNAGR